MGALLHRDKGPDQIGRHRYFDICARIRQRRQSAIRTDLNGLHRLALMIDSDHLNTMPRAQHNLAGRVFHHATRNGHVL